jgi:Na+-translocating ferredoxin:NAD+ oxidoreductase RnfD subunit
VPKAFLLAEKIELGQYLFQIVIELGMLVSLVVLAFLFSRFRPILTKPKIIQVVFKLFSLAFFYFAFDMIYSSITFFISK